MPPEKGYQSAHRSLIKKNAATIKQAQFNKKSSSIQGSGSSNQFYQMRMSKSGLQHSLRDNPTAVNVRAVKHWPQVSSQGPEGHFLGLNADLHDKMKLLTKQQSLSKLCV